MHQGFYLVALESYASNTELVRGLMRKTVGRWFGVAAQRGGLR